MTHGEQPPPPNFISLIPHLMGGEGHIIPYHQAVGQAVTQLGWVHCILSPQDPQVLNFPPPGSPTLPVLDLELEGNLGQKLLRIKAAIAFGQILAQQLKAMLKPNAPTILFLERFIHLQLLSLAIALYRVPVQNLSVWLLYRRDTHLDKTRWIYKLLNQLIARRLAPLRLQLLTDSELLAQSLAAYFGQPVSVMPIPHTDGLGSQEPISAFPQLLCWWAGAPREEKGWARIRTLVATSHPQARQICLLAAESADLRAIATGINHKSIPDHLSRDDYHYWLALSDVVLLPYDLDAYRERTSGIFTECIIAGKLPLVTPQTWMARELAQYELEALALDWESGAQVIDQILKLVADPSIQAKLQAMQAVYQERHNVTSFAQQVQTIYDQTVPLNPPLNPPGTVPPSLHA